MKKEIIASEIPEWEHGNVMIKSFSFKDTTFIQARVEKISKEELPEKTPTGETQYKEKIEWVEGTDIGYMSYFMLCAGIHFIRNKDVEGLYVKPEHTTEEKLNMLKNIDGKAGAYLTEKIGELMVGMNEDKKKS